MSEHMDRAKHASSTLQFKGSTNSKMYSCTIVHILVNILFANVYGKMSLPLCSDLNDELVKNMEICKTSSKYPHFPIELQPSLNIREVLELDEVEKSITFSIYTQFSWDDKAVLFKGQNSPGNQTAWIDLDGKHLKRTEFFTPLIDFSNQRKNELKLFFGEDSASKYQYFWHQPPHHFEYAEYHTITIGCALSFELYPFDSHQCNISIFNLGYTRNYLILLPALLGNNTDSELNRIEIKGHGLHFEISAESLDPSMTLIDGYWYNNAGFVFTLKRNHISALLTGYYLPSGMYSFLSGLSFWMPKDQLAGRMGMIVTLSLISTNSYNSLEAPADRGFSFLEIWMLGTHFPILFAIIEYSTVLALEKSDVKVGRYKIWDKFAFLIFCIYQIIFQTSYWFAASKHTL